MLKLSILLISLAVPAFPADCARILGKQFPDAVSLKRAEDGWLDAFLHGNTEYLECLLLPDYVSVSGRGIVRDRATIVEFARKNKGKSTPIPELPAPKVQIYGNTAVVQSNAPASPDGKYPAMFSSDTFAFVDGAWHAVFSQHTTVESGAK